MLKMGERAQIQRVARATMAKAQENVQSNQRRVEQAEQTDRATQAVLAKLNADIAALKVRVAALERAG